MIYKLKPWLKLPEVLILWIYTMILILCNLHALFQIPSILPVLGKLILRVSFLSVCQVLILHSISFWINPENFNLDLFTIEETKTKQNSEFDEKKIEKKTKPKFYITHSKRSSTMRIVHTLILVNVVILLPVKLYTNIYHIDVWNTEINVYFTVNVTVSEIIIVWKLN